MNADFYWVYILLCDNNTYYTGCTNNLEKRFQSHMDGTARCKYTRSFKPLKIAQAWKIEGGKSEALKIERFIKKLSRIEKEKIIIDPKIILQADFNNGRSIDSATKACIVLLGHHTMREV